MMTRQLVLWRMHLVFLGVLLNTHPVSALAQDQPNSEISLEVEFQSRQYLVGEPLWVRCSLVNRSAEDVVIPYDRYGETSRFLFEIVDARGRAARHLKYERDSIGPRALVIESGERHTETFNLYDEYAILGPGVHEISATFTSAGTYYHLGRGSGEVIERTTGWRGSLREPVGTMNIVAPTLKSDVAALDTLLEARGHSGSPYRYLFANADRRAKLLQEHGGSRYAAYARYFQAMADLERFRETTSQMFVAKAHDNLVTIESTEFGSLFQEKVAFARILALTGAHREAEALVEFEKFRAKYPKSTHTVADLKKWK